jgi:glycerol-3-phosphate dehydrogenase
VLDRVGKILGRRFALDTDAPIVQTGTATAGSVRHGPRYAGMPANEDDAVRLGSTDYCRRELRFAATHEAVAHLDDLMLRRTRAGLLLANGGLDELPALAPLICDALGWDDARWQAEVARYRAHWQHVHAPA